MFNGRAHNFNQDLSGWDVSSGTIFVSLGWILLNCSFILEDLCFWNDSITDFAIVLIATVSYVQRCYGLQSGSQWMGCIKWDKLCELRLDSYNLLILT